MNEVVEQWLFAELESSRFQAQLEALLDGESLDDPAVQLRVLSMFRHQDVPEVKGATYVDGLPVSEIDWWWATLGREELADVLYIDWEYWLEVTNGTRRPGDFLRHLEQEPNDAIAAIAAGLRAGSKPRPMIFVDAGPGTRLVVAEGHFRLTAYLLAEIDQVDVILGRSPLLEDWPDY
ncbi:hypothetical protein [Tenggerimyces flavus]|uniref:SMI1/KNR4 family protein n=1 Tax=Tenggerimyces flavus TaxID=1708749 RepID=A0ABV7Y5I8_9ACTN|nr:hypothetical protein [Tenggerimyces flavus]MBM7791208.1 hypothetical protein [Tenggerimyces flavus]